MLSSSRGSGLPMRSASLTLPSSLLHRGAIFGMTRIISCPHPPKLQSGTPPTRTPHVPYWPITQLLQASNDLHIRSVTPHVQNLLIWSSSSHGIGLPMHSTSLTLSSSLYVKGLIQSCYIWNDRDYKLAHTLLNFQSGTKHTK
jgi:hypothetical protein